MLGKPGQVPMAMELTGLREEPITILLLNGDNMKMSFKQVSLCPYNSTALRSHQRNIFVSVLWKTHINKRKSAENKHHWNAEAQMGQPSSQKSQRTSQKRREAGEGGGGGGGEMLRVIGQERLGQNSVFLDMTGTLHPWQLWFPAQDQSSQQSRMDGGAHNLSSLFY